MKAKIKAVVFDMDGVLIDARDWHFHALNEALEIFGAVISRDEHLDRFDGLPTKVKLQMLAAEGRLPEALHDVVEVIKQERTLRAAARLCFPRIEHLLMIGNLKRRGLLLGVATNSISLTARTMLKFAGVLDELDVLVTNQDVKLAKPDPEIYLLAAKKLGVSPPEVIVVEDNQFGIQAAEAAGCKVLRVTSPDELNLSLLIPELSE